jgi:transposase-like protein
VTTASGAAQRMPPHYCPYCGEDTIRPWGDDPDKGHADWRCESCLRVFSVRSKGLTGRD